MKVMKKAFGRIQDNLLKNPNCLHYTTLHYSTLQRSAQSRDKKKLKNNKQKHFLPGENFLRQKVFLLLVAWSNCENLDQLSTQKSNQNIFRPNLNPFWSVWCHPGQLQKESWHKTDCWNVVAKYGVIGPMKHIVIRARKLNFGENGRPPPCVRCQVSHVTCQMSWVMCQVSCFFFKKCLS